MWKLRVAEGGSMVRSVSSHVGRQHWEFDPDAGTPEERAEVERLRRQFTANRFLYGQSSDALMRIQMIKENGPRKPLPAPIKVEGVENVTEEAVTVTLRRGVDYLCSIQAHDGHWPAELAGPLFFMPVLIVALYITGGLDIVLTSEHRKEMKRYIYNHQNEDGGWPLHIDSHSTLFCTTFNYVSLRLLGEGPDDGPNDAVSKGRKWILDHGGAIDNPFWGKVFLTVLGVYEWEGCNPILPELLFLPRFSPIPGKIMCYGRAMYIPMSYLYGKRFVGKITPLIGQLRQELYVQPYHQINWKLARTSCAKVDIYYQHPLVQDLISGFVYNVGEPILSFWPFSKLRQKAIKVAMEHIYYEDFNSRYITTSCFTKALNTLARWVDDPNSEAYKLHLARVPDYFWVAEDGLKVQGTSGCQTWEAGFANQAIISSNLLQECGKSLCKAHDFIKASQIKENPSDNFKYWYRYQSKGTWPFGTHDQGWQVSDCTGESLTVALLYSQMPKEVVGDKIEIAQIYEAIDFLLNFQSKNGGFTAWEPQSPYRWLEKLNPTDIFENCIIEKEYVECTSSAIKALARFKKMYPGHRREEIESCIRKALQYICDEQNPDGSWRGSWGLCYTYGTWFAVDALTICGMSYNTSLRLRKACEFLLSKQLPDGGWGESFLSYTKKVYTHREGNSSHLVQTSWALLALIEADQAGVDPLPIQKGIKLLINSQLENGDFPHQEAAGAYFNGSTLNYGTYRNIFPTWALGEYRKILLNKI